ncbi:unnamed protein product [Allacma fusca]|uniref:glutathione transferase n=1 Tax=Allacma fusca TaxID=39272 RepID=A0A8J2PC33_9HEXA|nr:unnamed protein product [Allacma fusca]
MEVDYIDKHYPMPTPETGQGLWGEEKFKLGLDFPNIPYWIDGDFKITESKAILKHVVRMYDPSLFGKTIEEQSRANMVEDVMWDLFVSLTRTCMQYTVELREAFIKETPVKLRQISNFIGSKNWTLGEDVRQNFKLRLQTIMV